MSAHPRVSVIIPTYNRAAWVTQAVETVLAQTFRDFELIVVDDGSTDGAAETLAGFSGQLSVIRHLERRGVSAARNTGINAARGQWLAFLDSDDLWLPEKLAKQMAFLEARPEYLLCQTEEIWIRRGVRVNPPRHCRKTEGDIFLPSLARCLISPSAVALHRRLLENHGGFDETLPAAEDYDLWLRLTWRYPVGLVPDALVVKRGGHEDQLSRQWGLDRWRIRALEKLLQEPALPEAHRQAARRMLAAKCAVYALGCAKRGRMAEADYYRGLEME
jgi:glycosyltransferase involved in cell wall biosynthesis